MGKKNIKAVVVSTVAIVLVSVTAVTVIAERKGRLFQLTDRLNRTFSSAELSVCSVETGSYTPQELESDSRIIFDQSGMLVNKTHMLKQDFSADICEYKDTDVYMNSAMINSYAQLSSDIMKRFGQKLYVSSSYRTAEEQAAIIIEEGANATAVGASEHQTGLALDVYVSGYAGSGFIKSPVGRWVNSECSEYGFIIRYPYYKENVDGIGYEPWHIRYVGIPHSQIVYGNSFTLEEYFDILSDGEWHRYDNYLISRQNGERIELPSDMISATVSPDNTGGYLVTVKVKE